MSRPLLFSETLPDLRARPQAPEQTQVDGIGMSDRPPASSFFIPPDWQTKRPCQRDLAFVELDCFTSFALWEMLGVAVAVTIICFYFGRGVTFCSVSHRISAGAKHSSPISPNLKD